MKTLTWSLLCPEAVVGGPMRKADCGIVMFHGDKLAVIGGYGFPTGPTPPGSTFIRDTNITDRIAGNTNEHHVFNTSQGLWSSLTLRGTRLPPCAQFTMTSVDDYTAILFAGYQPGRGCVSDLYIIDFDTMETTRVDQPDGEPWPVERSAHAACCLGFGGDHTHLVVTGGTGIDYKTLTDIWMFDLSSRTWKEVTLPDALLPRWSHSTTVISLCQGLEELILFGGTTDDAVPGKQSSHYSRIAETTIITFGQLGSEWVLVGVTNNSQRGNSERVREKIDLKCGIDTKGPSFDSEKRITAYALYRIELGGVQLRREISNKNREFQAVLRLKQPDANLAMIKWINTERKTDITPTWKNLFLILRLIDLDHLSKQIEAYLRGTTVEQLPGDISSIEQVPGGKKFDLDSVFTMASLTQLEKVGIPVLTQLEANNHAFQALIRVKKDDVSGAINKWLTAPVLSRIIPSWKNFLTVLCLIQLDGLAEQIKDYLMKHPLFTSEMEQGEMEGDGRKMFILRQELSDRDETICQLRKESEANEDTIKMLKERNQQLRKENEANEDTIKVQKEEIQQLRNQLLSAGVVKKEKKEIKPPLFHFFEQVPSPTMLSLTQPQQSLGPYNIKEESSLEKIEELMMLDLLPVQVKKEPTEATTEYLSSAGGADVRATQLLSTEEQLESGLVQPFTVTPTKETVEIKPSLLHPTGLPGVEVCAEKTVLVTNNPQSFIWKGYGLKLHIPQGCLPQDIPQCQIAIKASLAGQYEFPENSHLVSAVFWLRCEPLCTFTKKLSLEIDHCAKLDNTSRLSIVRAVCSQRHLPYTFKRLGGTFNQHSSSGAIELSGFSGVAATQGDSEEREYCAMLYYLIIRHELLIHFVVTWNTKCHITVVKEEYEQKGALKGHIQPIAFQSNDIELDIPMEGVVCTSCEEWTISPLFPPVVVKKNVDSFEVGKMIPSCQLIAEFLGKEVSSLKQCVKLVGAEKPYDQFLIRPPADIIAIVAGSGKSDDQKRRWKHTSGDSFPTPDESATEHAGPSPKKHTGSEMQWTHEDTQNDRKRQWQHTPSDSLSSPEGATEHAGPSPKKRHTGSEMQLHLRTHEDTQSKVKPQKVVKSGQITDADRLFNNIAKFIYDKYTKIGTELGLEYKYLRDELETGKYTTLQGSEKAAKMLHLWQESVGEDHCTYSVLAAALEKHDTNRPCHMH